jgi:hypothetical protein
MSEVTQVLRLWEIASIVRSKNAGPFRVTLDILFSDSETYQRVRDSGAVTRKSVAEAYDIPVDEVSSLFNVDMANAIKVTLRRSAQGAFGERDMYGCQQHAPLMDLPVSLKTDRPASQK